MAELEIDLNRSFEFDKILEASAYVMHAAWPRIAHAHARPVCALTRPPAPCLILSLARRWSP